MHIVVHCTWYMCVQLLLTRQTDLGIYNVNVLYVGV